MGNGTLLKSEKAKAESDLLREIAKTAGIVAALSYAYRHLGYDFQFANRELKEKIDHEFGNLRLRIFGNIKSRGEKIAKISRDENLSLYGLDYQMSKAEIDEFLAGDIEGATTKERIAKHTGQIKGEMEAMMAAGLFLALSQDKLVNLFMSGLRAPYASKIISDAMMSGKFSAVRLNYGELKYGRGRYASGFSNLLRLDFDVSQRVFVKNTTLSFGADKRIVGVMPHRGSNFPCIPCDNVANRIFNIEDQALPVHARCVCFYTPVLADGREFSREI